MAKLDIAEKRKPQDGKIRFRGPMGTIELRVATIPTSGGNEDVVMRILAASKPLPLDKMGFSERNIAAFKQILQKPYGVCLVVGPTGSGKTTTLHSALGFINTEDMKIWTAEDPVEITQAGLRQVQVFPKIDFTFAAAMRSFLRADPDVIMVGEMRDHETAAIGVEASLTGHLVFSTLHTNSAPETIVRLLDMDIDPFNFADALLGILAQRLVRTLCPACREEYVPTPDEFAELVSEYGAEHWEKVGVHYSPSLRLYRPKGCPKCGGSGYKGRMGIHELLVGTDEVKRMVQKRRPVEELREQAIRDGMTTLLQDGILKVLKGHTDFKQVRAVCIK
jgi:type II secretory ATPase GspE/PulE/Tfp pilus assembly ATPase PilB-like protein